MTQRFDENPERVNYSELLNGDNKKMPFKSKAQAKLLFATKPKIAKEFAKETKSIKALPNKVKKKKKRKK